MMTGTRTLLWFTTILLPLALARTLAGPTDEPSTPAGKPDHTPTVVFERTVPAINPTALYAQIDEKKVFGWISGVRSAENVKVKLRYGKISDEVAIEADNTFTWAYTPGMADTIELGLSGSLRQTLRLPNTVNELSPCVFFVIDRPVYRPGDTLHFVGYLRAIDAQGQFTTLSGKQLQVELESKHRKIKAATFEVTSDDHGRITGEYAFTDADGLDEYTLHIPEFVGAAHLTLAEFRKSKVQVQIDGEVQGHDLNLKFTAKDFLNRPVAGSEVTYDVQIVPKSESQRGNGLLNPAEFAYAPEQLSSPTFANQLSDDERLLWKANGFVTSLHPSMLGGSVDQRDGNISLKGSEPGFVTVKLKPTQLDGHHQAVVRAVFIDASGREQRTVETIPIESPSISWSLRVAKDRFLLGEVVHVGIVPIPKGPVPTSIVIVKLEPGELPKVVQPHLGSRLMPVVTQAATRTVVGSVPVHFGGAQVRFREPGAYKLIAIRANEKNEPERSEVGVIVDVPELGDEFLLRLDRNEIESGERLGGTLHSRLKNARVLLTVRDANGIQTWKLVNTDEKGQASFVIDLPSEVSYGCCLQAAYMAGSRANQHHRLLLTQEFFHVIPRERLVKITTSVKEEVKPGEDVTIALSVDRKEPVDLIVSVYDQSFLGVAKDESPDVRNFFLADNRIRDKFSSELVRQRLSAVTLGELIRRESEWRRLLKTNPNSEILRRFDEFRTRNRKSPNDTWTINPYELLVLMRLAGVPARLQAGLVLHPYAWAVSFAPKEDTTLEEILNLALASTWRLRYDHHERCVVLALAPEHQHLNQWPHSPFHPMNFSASGSPYRGFTFNPTPNGYLSMNFGQGFRNGAYFCGGFNCTAQFGFGSGFQQTGFSGGGFGGSGFNGASLHGGGFGGGGFSGSFASGNAAYSFYPNNPAFMTILDKPIEGRNQLQPDRAGIEVRRDFSDLAYWNGKVRTDENGKAQVTFKVPDSLTNWRVVVTAVSEQLHVGRAEDTFRTNKPVMIWPMLPRSFTVGDHVEVFAVVHNRTKKARTLKVRLNTNNGVIDGPELRKVRIPAEQQELVSWKFVPAFEGSAQLLMTAETKGGSDASLKTLPVIQNQVEQVITLSGVIRHDAIFTIPNEVDLKTANLEITFSPSRAADLADTLNYLAEYPYGCVEQTMSRFLPTVRVAQIMKAYQIEHPELEQKVPGFVAAGVKRLLELQNPDGGWGWHGNGQSHEMMRPYALYGLIQAEDAGYAVPKRSAIQSGLTKLKQYIDSTGEGQTSDRLYSMYVYSLRKEMLPIWWQFIEQRLDADAFSDYASALALEMAVRSGQHELGDKLALRLKERARRSLGQAHWGTAGFSGWGDDRYEITAAVLKALVAHDPKNPLISDVLQFFDATKQGNRWNSTKATAMVIYAMSDFLLVRKDAPNGATRLTFSVNGKAPTGLEFQEGASAHVTVQGTQLRQGENKIRFETPAPTVAYRLVLKYHQSGSQVKAHSNGITVERKFFLLENGGISRELNPGETVPRGSYILSEVRAWHDKGQAMSYVLVEDFKPSSGEFVPSEDLRFKTVAVSTPYALREERRTHAAFHHESTPNPLQARSVLRLEFAGEFVIPPARVEMMYQTEVHGHSDGFSLRVADD